jgi:hypothetical protein
MGVSVQSVFGRRSQVSERYRLKLSMASDEKSPRGKPRDAEQGVRTVIF